VEYIVMLSQKARYALHALFLLAARTPGEPVMIAEIAKEARLPRKFLEQILLELKKRGIVHSVRGKHGGYALGRAPDKISFAEIIRAIDGPLALSPCVSVTAYRKCDDCVDEASCVLRKILLAVRDATADILENRTLAEALPKAQPGPASGESRRRAPSPTALSARDPLP
jgi:Rrf2 family protein